jgi:hypothetical protein
MMNDPFTNRCNHLTFSFKYEISTGLLRIGRRPAYRPPLGDRPFVSLGVRIRISDKEKLIAGGWLAMSHIAGGWLAMSHSIDQRKYMIKDESFDWMLWLAVFFSKLQTRKSNSEHQHTTVKDIAHQVVSLISVDHSEEALSYWL